MAAESTADAYEPPTFARYNFKKRYQRPLVHLSVAQFPELTFFSDSVLYALHGVYVFLVFMVGVVRCTRVDAAQNVAEFELDDGTGTALVRLFYQDESVQKLKDLVLNTVQYRVIGKLTHDPVQHVACVDMAPVSAAEVQHHFLCCVHDDHYLQQLGKQQAERRVNPPPKQTAPADKRPADPLDAVLRTSLAQEWARVAPQSQSPSELTSTSSASSSNRKRKAPPPRTSGMRPLNPYVRFKHQKLSSDLEFLATL